MADELEIKLPSIDVHTNIQVSGEGEIRRLSAELEAAYEQSDRLGSSLQQTIEELEGVRQELNNLERSRGIDILKEELEKFRSTAQQSAQEFRSFLESVNLNDVYGKNDWQFTELFDKLHEGSITASQAILQVKTEFRALMEENYGNAGGLFDSQMVQGFTASLEHLGEVITDVARRLDSIEQNGVRAIGGTGGGGDVAGVLQQIEAATAGMSEEARTAYEPITNLVKAMTEYASLDDTKLLGVSQAFRNIADVGSGSYGTKSINNIVYLAKQLQALSTSGAGAIRFDFTGLNELHVSKASLNNLATYLPEIAKVNTSKLKELSAVDLTNFNNVKVSKSAIENISRLTEAIQVLREVKAATVSADGGGITIDGGGDGGGGAAAEQSKNQYKDAVRAVREYYSVLSQKNPLPEELARTKNAFDLLTDSVNRSKLSEQEQIDLQRIMDAEASKYEQKLYGRADAETAAAQAAREQATAEKELLADINNIANAENAYQSALNRINAQRSQLLSTDGGVNTEAYSNLVEYTHRLDELLNEFHRTGDMDAFKVGMKELNTEYLRNTGAVQSHITAQREAAQAEKEQADAARQALTVEKEYQSVLGRIQQAMRNYTAAKTSKNASSRAAYENLVKEEAALRDVHAATQGTTDGFKTLKTAVDRANITFTDSSNTIKAAGDNTKNFFDRMGGLASKFSAWFGITRIIMATVRTVKQMVSASIELESAFAQLKIITNATDEEMSKFADTAVRLAKNLGQSVTDVTKSIETFSRLGYNLSDAASLAEYATILSNVAAVDASEATTGLTSIIKGFNMDVTNAEHIADVLVNVGQKYAVSASEMMTAYEKSGAALNATNTSFEKSAGLIAAANASVECCRAA